jgi:hypothetical protein
MWFFTASRFLSSEEGALVTARMRAFLSQWTSHGAQMAGYCDVVLDRILWVAVDESLAHASGCGIDALTREVQAIAHTLELDFFDRQAVVFQRAGEKPESLRLHEFWAHCKAGNIHDEILVVDTTVKTFDSCSPGMLTPWRKTWHGEMWNS